MRGGVSGRTLRDSGVKVPLVHTLQGGPRDGVKAPVFAFRQLSFRQLSFSNSLHAAGSTFAPTFRRFTVRSIRISPAFMQIATRLILASQSPRRRDLLDQLGLTFTIQVSPAEEVIPDGEPPAAVVQQIAAQKAVSIAAQYPTALTLAADTVVVLDNEILGKPASKPQARGMLRRLQNSTHDVYTGISLIHPASDREVTEFEKTRVTFASVSDDEIDAYVASGSPMDKAGGYGIQDHIGPLYIEGIQGDYYNVMGLPLRRLYVTLQRKFADLLLL